MRRRLLSSAGAPASSLAALVGSATRPSGLALLAPQQDVSWTYEELDHKARKLACGLEDLGYERGSVAISDLPNTAENLLLQCALSHLGATIATPPKDDGSLAKLMEAHNVRGVICVDGAAPPCQVQSHRALPTVHLEALGRPAGGSVPFDELIVHCPPRGAPPAAHGGTLLGIYGGAALTQAAALSLGAAAAERLELSESDRVCCSVTLMHAFGIASSICSALTAGGAVVLPAVGGIKGCGNPAQRAEVTLAVLAATEASVLFGDTHTLRAMAAETTATLPALRTGVIKIGSGNDFLDGVTEAPGGKDRAPLPLAYDGVKLWAFGKKA